jgi:putative transposase
MAGKREKPEDIVSKLRQVEVLQGQGMTIADAVRQIGTTEQTYYRWRKQYGGMNRDQLKRLKELEKENQRLRRVVADQNGKLSDKEKQVVAGAVRPLLDEPDGKQTREPGDAM